MKIEPRNISRNLQEIGQFRVVLLYGENTGLIRERASQIVKIIAKSLDDPFKVCILDKDNHTRLIEEATALSLIGGQRVIWVREGADNLAKSLESFLETASKNNPSINNDSLIVIESSTLSTRSPLRLLAEKHPLTASIACYAETGRALTETISTLLGKKKITPEALNWLTTFLATDRAIIRNEIEKLLLYMGEKPTIELEDVQQSIGDGSDFSLEDGLYAALCGNQRSTNYILERAFEEGTNAVTIIRTLLYHLHRLQQVRSAVESGTPTKTAISQLRPPVFFKQMNSFAQVIHLWNSSRLLHVAERFQHLEYLCKQTQMPAITLCKQFITSLASEVK